MKKHLTHMLAVFLLLSSLSSCSSETPQVSTEPGSIQILATIYPEYDWVMNVLGDNPANAKVSMLLENGMDMHSYQPSAQDILRISTCDLLVYVGGESDAWVNDAIQQASNPGMHAISLMDEMDENTKHKEEDDENQYDEHVWLSLKNAKSFVNCIAAALASLDPENKDAYDANAQAYIEKLNALDKAYEEAVSNANTTTLLFADRFPFRYLTEDYGLSFFAAFDGCSAETEASFETITFLSQKADELHLPAILTIEGSDHRIAKTVLENMKDKDIPILSMNSLQSITTQDIQNGATYLSIMEDNLSILKQALK